jgi:hypothetical protein
MEVIDGNDQLRRLDASSEPGPENKRARTSEKLDIADKVRMILYFVDHSLSSPTSRLWTSLEGRSL